MIVNGHTIKAYAILYRANLCEADLSEAIGVIDAGQDHRGYRFLAHWRGEDGWWVHAGCRYFSFEEAREHWSAKQEPARSLALARVNMLRQLTELHGDPE